MKFTCEFCEFKPWSGAVDTMDKIEAAGKVDELEQYLEVMFSDEIPADTDINDLLWFDGDSVLSYLGITDDDDEDDEDDDENDWDDDEEDEDE